MSLLYFFLGVVVGVAGVMMLRRAPEAPPPTPPESINDPPPDWDSARKAVESEARLEIEALQQRIHSESEALARGILTTVMERLAPQTVSEGTTALVGIPSEDVKGRIIGREGRNIRSFEQVTGVDLIVDDLPDAVVISCFDPVRRETARLTLTNLIADGRIHPSRIEEVHKRSCEEVEALIAEAGIEAAKKAGCSRIPHKVLVAMGRLRFRMSSSQNVLDHSIEVANLCALIAAELGVDATVARTAGFLHDIGKGLDETWEGPHALAGQSFLAKAGVDEAVCHAVGAHHRDILPSSAAAEIVILADILSATRPGARRPEIEHFVERLESLEAISNSFPGVEQSFAVQAGRELRVIVRPEEVDDASALVLASEIAGRIRETLEYPAPVKVVVIREFRAQETAR